MTYQDIRDKYVQKVKNYLQNVWKIQPSFHLCDVIASVLMQRDGVIDHGGHFVQAVLRNDLQESFARADYEIQNNMRYILATLVNVGTPAVKLPEDQYVK